MKKLILNIFVTTGISLVTLAIIIWIRSWFVFFHLHILHIFAANAVIHIGLLFVPMLHRSYRILNMLMDIAYVATVLIVFGWRLDWFVLTPIWVLILMAAGIYLIVYTLDMLRVRAEISEINNLLNKRDTNLWGKQSVQ